MATPLSILSFAELTEYARLEAAAFDAATAYSDIMPYKGVVDISYSYNKDAAAVIDEAVFRAYDAPSSLGARPSGAKIMGEIPAISRKIPLSELAQLKLRNAPDKEIIAQHFADAASLAKSIVARTARARVELLETGKVAINENGYESTYDSGRANANTVTALAGTAKWDAPTTAKPISNVLAWKAIILAATGVDADTLDVSAATMADLQVNDEVRGALVPLSLSPARISQDAVAEAFLGQAGVTVKVAKNPPGMAALRDADKVVLYASRPLGHTLYGTPIEASRPLYAGVSEQPGLYAGGWEDNDPATQWTHVVGITLPILTIPDATLSCKVS